MTVTAGNGLSEGNCRLTVSVRDSNLFAFFVTCGNCPTFSSHRVSSDNTKLIPVSYHCRREEVGVWPEKQEESESEQEKRSIQDSVR